MRAAALAALLSLLQASPNGGKPPRLHLTGDGRACRGYLRLSAHRLIWKSAFSTCDSPYRMLGEQDATLTLELTGLSGPRTHACTFKVVTLHQQEPAEAYPEWEVSGFASLAESRKGPAEAPLGCVMQSDVAGPATPVQSPR